MARLEKRTVEINSHQIECEVCTNAELSHHTTPASVISIFREATFRLTGDSKAVSFSANPNQAFGGRVKIILDSEKLDAELQPACYYGGLEKSERRAIDEKEMQLFQEVPGRSLNEVRAILGLVPDVYKDECEWYSRMPVPLLPGAVKELEYFITPPYMPYRVDCERHHPHYVDLTSDTLFQEMKDEIAQVRKIAEEKGIPFSVASCFPYIRRSWQYIVLNDENLRRLAEGEEPDATFEKPEEVCVSRVGCPSEK